jgi:nucleoside-diphosphate-sugar epimerase
MSNVLVTHADLPLGRRIVKVLWHDTAVGRIVALGEGPAPRAFGSYRVGLDPRLVYERLDHAKQRAVADLFRSRRLRELGVDTVVHVPRHGAAPEGLPVVARVPARTAEARLVLHHAVETKAIRTLVALGSAFVYKLAPGNANHLGEESALDLDPAVPAEIRSWIDCDMLFQAEAAGRRRRVVLLRLPTVVASGGYVYLHPALEGPAGLRVRPAGFDPLCAVIADKDVARAVATALASHKSGVFNVAGRELVPLSMLGRWTGRPCLPLPGPLLRAAAAGVSRVARAGLPGLLDGPHLRYGMSLDTRRVARELGFEPRYRIGVARAGDGAMRLEAVAA